eukprot:1138426-Pelagomonas_calceolata.AAC.3
MSADAQLSLPARPTSACVVHRPMVTPGSCTLFVWIHSMMECADTHASLPACFAAACGTR